MSREQNESQPNSGSRGRLLHKIGEACALMGIGRSTCYALMRSGALKVVYIGPRGIRIPQSEIERFIAVSVKRAEL
jgi:excisionase family DNA binding protein